MNELLAYLADATNPRLLWLIFLAVAGLSVIISLIFTYHWYNYQTDKKMFLSAGLIYAAGLIFLLSMMVTAILIFTNAGQ
ncbi:MAG: hypothetical protein WDZ85_00470 [Candidatus Paceibacterota bacterium]